MFKMIDNLDIYLFKMDHYSKVNDECIQQVVNDILLAYTPDSRYRPDCKTHHRIQTIYINYAIKILKIRMASIINNL